MTEKYIDFDQYREEKKDKPLIIKAFGEEIELSSSPKLSIMEKLIELRNKKGKKATIPEEEVFEMLGALLGKEQLRLLIDNDVTTDEAEWLLMEIWKQYNPNKNIDSEEDGSKNRPSSTLQKNGE